MSYQTSPFSRLPIKVRTSDAPYLVDLEIAFRTFNGEVIPKDAAEFLGVSATVHVHCREAAEGLVAELRAAADSIEAFLPQMTA